MQEQGKRLLLAVALIMGLLFVWQTFVHPKDADQQQKADQTKGQTTGVTPLGGVKVVAQQSQVGTGAPVAPDRGSEQLIALKFDNVVATFSSFGGVLSSWQLTDPRYAQDATKGDLLPDSKAHSDAGAFAVNFDRGSTFMLPEKAEWTGKKVSDTVVEYSLSTPELDVTKTFEVVPEAYIVKATVKVVAKSEKEAHQHLAITAFEFQDPKTASTGSSRIQPRQWDSSTMRSDGDNLSTPVTSILAADGGPRWEPQIKWTGFEHPYLLVAFAPNPGNGNVAKHTYADPTGLMRTDMIFGDAPLAKGVQPLVAQVVAYMGPKNLDQLEHADTVAGYATGFKAVVDLGWFAIIGRPLLWLLLKFHDVLGNWGIAIVFLTLLVKGATLYWTTKSMRSMKAMAVLGPQIKALQEKHKGDKQKAQVETMALYKTHGVNPLAGCLPIVLQMPIWIALYRMLSSAGELYQQPFIPGWINDLTASDPTYVLPVVLVVTMFAQARLTPQTMDPSQKMQQRMMQYGMPLMFGAMSFFFPAGLTLYIFTNTCLSAVHSIWMNKYDKKSLALAAQLKKVKEATAAAKETESKKESDAKAVREAKASAAKSDDDDASESESDEKSDKSDKGDNGNDAKPRVRTSQRRKKGGRR